MAFVPVSITLGAGGHGQPIYDRSIELTARQLVAFRNEAGDMTEPLEAIAADMHTQLEAAFATQGASGASGRWTVLSERYGAWKAQRGPGLPILVGLKPKDWVGRRSNPPGQRRNANQTYETSGAMMREMLMPLTDQLTWHITPKRLAYTPTSDIAGYHETGTDKMPARPPVDLTATFMHSVDRQFVRWLAGLVKRSGL